MKKLFILLLAGFALSANAQQTQTYAEKLGWPKGARVIILHVDDAGMSHESNLGVEEATSVGVANSTSVMMPCSWVPEFKTYMDKHPTLDAGLHLTLTSEWDNYRWGPLAGKPAVPNLVDKQGAMWPSVEAVYFKATGDDVDKDLHCHKRPFQYQ